MDFDGRLVAHGAGGDEQSRLALEDFRSPGFQPVNGRVFAIDVVADFRLRHRATHGRRGLGHRVAAQIHH